MENKTIKNLLFMFGIGVAVEVAMLIISSVAFTYSWFSATVTPKNEHDQIVTTGTLELTYIDGPEIKLENVRPGKTLTKEVSVKNTGTLDAEYNLVWQELNNEITNDEMVISITCSSTTDKNAPGESCPELAETPVSGSVLIKGATIESGYTHNYVITITFKELNKDQNYNQGKNFSGVLGVNEYKESNTPEFIYCTYDGEVKNGVSFVKDIYKYSYYNNQWNVVLADQTSTDPVTEAPCTHINDIKVESAEYMFANCEATSIDVSKFNTSNITNMYGMFFYVKVPEIIGLDKLDTSNVTIMDSMFGSSKLQKLDLSNFDTSKVTSMNNMFRSSGELKTIIVSDKFVVSSGSDMFTNATSLVGGAGTKYDSSKTDKTYARIDGVDGLPGYFTAK